MTDEELITFAREFRRGLLGSRKSEGMCFVVSAPLAALLNVSGVPASVSATQVRWRSTGRSLFECPHFWIALADGRVLDPTIDQFNGTFPVRFPEIYLGLPLNDIHSKPLERSELRT